MSIFKRISRWLVERYQAIRNSIVNLYKRFLGGKTEVADTSKDTVEEVSDIVTEDVSINDESGVNLLKAKVNVNVTTYDLLKHVDHLHSMIKASRTDKSIIEIHCSSEVVIHDKQLFESVVYNAEECAAFYDDVYYGVLETMRAEANTPHKPIDQTTLASNVAKEVLNSLENDYALLMQETDNHRERCILYIARVYYFTAMAKGHLHSQQAA